MQLWKLQDHYLVHRIAENINSNFDIQINILQIFFFKNDLS